MALRTLKLLEDIAIYSRSDGDIIGIRLSGMLPKDSVIQERRFISVPWDSKNAFIEIVPENLTMNVSIQTFLVSAGDFTSEKYEVIPCI